jgi:hypothetical protein
MMAMAISAMNYVRSVWSGWFMQDAHNKEIAAGDKDKS